MAKNPRGILGQPWERSRDVDLAGRPLNPGHPWHRDQRGDERQREQFFRERLDQYEQAWRRGNAPVLLDVLALCKTYNRPLPAWANDAMRKLLNAALQTSSGRGRTTTPLAVYRQAQIHYARWSAVVEARERKDELKELGYWNGAFAAAAKVLQGTNAFGSPRTIRESYDKVQRDMKRGAGAMYTIAKLDP